MQKWLNNKGVTLIEILASLVIVSIIGALAYSVLFQGYSNYQRIQAETELRDEADLIMASLIKDLFVSKVTELKLENNCTDSQSYLTVSKKGVSPAISYKNGFRKDKVYINDQEVKFSNSNVKLVPNNCTENSPTYIKKKSDTAEYNIVFTLKTKKGNNDHEIKFENTVQVIDDTEGGKNNEAAK